jgi:hypothetical protein
VGRQEMMDWLLERVSPDVEKGHCQWTAIEGLGGVGKTQMALEVAYRFVTKILSVLSSGCPPWT